MAPNCSLAALLEKLHLLAKAKRFIRDAPILKSSKLEPADGAVSVAASSSG